MSGHQGIAIMVRIHQDSPNNHKSDAVGLLKLPGTQVDIEAGHWDVIHPTQRLDDATEIEFNAAAGPLFTDLAHSYIKVRLSVSKTGGAIVAADALSLTNLGAHSLWSKINLYVSGVDVTEVIDTTPAPRWCSPFWERTVRGEAR